MKRRIFSILLAVCMVTLMLPANVWAAESSGDGFSTEQAAEAADTAVEEIQTMIDALPAVEDIPTMDADAQQAAYTQGL